jgi:N-acyl amino acid synthase of PEP-CTERM/exosortase system
MLDVLSADTPELREQAYRLRYQVYCIENDYEDPSNNLEGLETDEYDAHSLHILLVDQQVKLTVGTARLILPRPDRLDRSFPIQYACCDSSPINVHRYPVQSMAEISRFCISKSLRQLRADDVTAGAGGGTGTREVILRMTVRLMEGLVRLSVQAGITHLCSMMEPALLRLLAGLGIYFQPLGPMVEFHGQRQPCHQDLAVLLLRIQKERPDVWPIVTANGAHWTALLNLRQPGPCCTDQLKLAARAQSA